VAHVWPAQEWLRVGPFWLRLEAPIRAAVVTPPRPPLRRPPVLLGGALAAVAVAALLLRPWDGARIAAVPAAPPTAAAPTAAPNVAIPTAPPPTAAPPTAVPPPPPTAAPPTQAGPALPTVDQGTVGGVVDECLNLATRALWELNAAPLRPCATDRFLAGQAQALQAVGQQYAAYIAVGYRLRNWVGWQLRGPFRRLPDGRVEQDVVEELQPAVINPLTDTAVLRGASNSVRGTYILLYQGGRWRLDEWYPTP
jgi:hypothetical protein